MRAVRVTYPDGTIEDFPEANGFKGWDNRHWALGMQKGNDDLDIVAIVADVRSIRFIIQPIDHAQIRHELETVKADLE